MFALAEKLGVSIWEIEAMPVAIFHEWLAYFEVKREREQNGNRG